jgi:hypothetical protein
MYPKQTVKIMIGNIEKSLDLIPDDFQRVNNKMLNKLFLNTGNLHKQSW